MPYGVRWHPPGTSVSKCNMVGGDRETLTYLGALLCACSRTEDLQDSYVGRGPFGDTGGRTMCDSNFEPSRSKHSAGSRDGEEHR